MRDVASCFGAGAPFSIGMLIAQGIGNEFGFVKIPLQHAISLKTILAFIVILGLCPVISAQLSLSSQVASPGSSLLLPLSFGPQDGSISGVQFDLEYDSSAMSLVATLGDSARNSGKSLFYADLAPNVRRFLIVGANQNVIPNRTLVNLFVNLTPSAVEGAYSLSFTNVSGTNSSGSLAPVTSVDGTVTVHGPVASNTSLLVSGVLNGGSLLGGPISPGEVLTLIGSGIGPASITIPNSSSSSSVLSGTSVTFDGTAAPILYASANQINLVTPYEVSGKSSTQLQVLGSGQMIADLPMPVVPTVPAILTVDGSGAGQGFIFNQDSTLNSQSNPSVRGTIATLFAVGAGQTDPQGIDGQVAGQVVPAPLLPVSVQVGGQDAEVIYANAAAGLIAGVLRVDFRIPSNVIQGYSIPIILTVGTASSQPGVSLTIR